MHRTSFGFSTPQALIIAGVLIAVAVVVGPLVRGEQTSPTADSGNAPVLAKELATDILPTDHILGDIKTADIVLTEYSDLECPFCANAHPILESLVNESEGSVAWIYRHFPLTEIHAEAMPRAIASECIALNSGDEAFWQYIEGIFTGAETDSYTEYGVTTEMYTACATDQSILDKIQNDTELAAAAGATGTPHTVVANKKEGIILQGAQPKNVWDQVIEFVRTGELPAQDN